MEPVEMSEEDRKRAERERRHERRKRKVLGAKESRTAFVLGREGGNPNANFIDLEIGDAKLEDAADFVPEQEPDFGAGGKTGTGPIFDLTSPWYSVMKPLLESPRNIPLTIRYIPVILLVFSFYSLNISSRTFFAIVFGLVEVTFVGYEFIINWPLPQGKLPLIPDSELYFTGIAILNRAMRSFYAVYKDLFIAGFVLSALTYLKE